MPRPFDLVPPLLEGLWVTLQLTVGGAVVAFVLAWLAGLGRLSRLWVLRWPAIAYIEVFRGTSALVQLFWFFYALPLLGISLNPMTAGVVVLGLNIGAYGAEVVRGAIQSIDRGQHEACTALNLSPARALWLVIAPQAVVRMLPPAGNLLIELLKSTALVSLITLSDLTFKGLILRADSLRTTEIFGTLLVMYFVIALGLTAIMRWVEARVKRGWHMETAS